MEAEDGEEASFSAESKPQPTPKQQYRLLKKRFKFLVYENECYQEELRNLQRKLLKLSRDKNFLLDRLLLYENLSDSSDDSDASEPNAPKKPKRKPRPSSRKRADRKRPAADTKAADGEAKIGRLAADAPLLPLCSPSPVSCTPSCPAV